MNEPYRNGDDGDLDELLRQVDKLLEEPEIETPMDDMDSFDFTPEGLEEDEPMVYQNFSNGYGKDLRNYSNGYGTGQQVELPREQTPSIPAYNADFYREQKRGNEPKSLEPEENYPVYQEELPEKPKKQKQKKEKAPKTKKHRFNCCGCGCITMIVALALVVIAVVVAVNWVFQPPQSDYSIGERKDDTATILICGTDKDGTRTDTMMLLYISGSEKQVSLLSIPRDTYTITAAGNAAKLNSAYGRNGCGEQGMEGLMDYIQDIIGYRPDGYILVDLTLVEDIVDIMGGLEFEVAQDMSVDGVSLKAGLQHLSGEEVLTLLRYRKGYATADLARVEVQRQVIQAALEQWLSADHLQYVTQVLDSIEVSATTNLNWRNYLWMAKNILTGIKNMSSNTLPGYATNRGGVSYYVLYKDQVAEMIDGSYNPFEVDITTDILKIAG